MTLPIVAGNANGNSGSSGTGAHVITLPGSIGVGDLLVVALATTDSVAGQGAYAYPDTAISGTQWEYIGRSFSYPVGLHIFAKIATASNALTLTTGPGLIGSAHVSYRVTGHGSSVTVTMGVPGFSTNPDPPSCTQSGSAQDTMWLAVAATSSFSSIPSAAPSGFANLHTANTTVGITAIGSAELGIAASSTEDPGAFTATIAYNTTATIAIASTNIPTKDRVTQTAVETATQVNPKLRMTQIAMETASQVNPKLRMTQIAVEVLSSSTAAPANARSNVQVCS